MMKLFTLLLLAVAACAHVEHERVVINNRQAFPAEYNQLGLADASSPVTFYLALKQQNMDKLEKLFWEVSNPDSSKYKPRYLYYSISSRQWYSPGNGYYT